MKINISIVSKNIKFSFNVDIVIGHVYTILYYVLWWDKMINSSQNPLKKNLMFER